MADKKDKKPTGMLIDGILGSEAIDSSGEILDVKGADISDWEAGTMLLNWEHRGDEASGASANDIVGKIVYAKKIFKESDCENDRQRAYWKKIELPFIYGIGRLFDAAGHPGAAALAAIIRDHHANGEMIVARFSVEGSTLKRDGQRLLRSAVRRVAVTVKPCNRSANSGLLADPNAPPGFELQAPKDVQDALADVAEAKKNELRHPGHLRLGGSWEGELVPFSKNDRPEQMVRKLLKLKLAKARLAKAMTAGMASGAPSTLTGGAALQREDISQRVAHLNQAKAAFRDYGKAVTDKDDFRKFVKHRLPEVSDSFVDHFVDRCHDFSMRKAEEQRTVVRLEGLVLNLRKALDEARVAAAPKTVRFADHDVIPGVARHAGGEHALLLEDHDGYVGVPADKLGRHEAEDLVRLPRLKEATHFVVLSRPKVLIAGAPHLYGGCQ